MVFDDWCVMNGLGGLGGNSRQVYRGRLGGSVCSVFFTKCFDGTWRLSL